MQPEAYRSSSLCERPPSIRAPTLDSEWLTVCGVAGAPRKHMGSAMQSPHPSLRDCNPIALQPASRRPTTPPRVVHRGLGSSRTTRTAGRQAARAPCIRPNLAGATARGRSRHRRRRQHARHRVIRFGRQRCHPEERERRGIWVGDCIVRSAPTQIPPPRFGMTRLLCDGCRTGISDHCCWSLARLRLRIGCGLLAHSESA
jgi:hypothetical protein